MKNHLLRITAVLTIALFTLVLLGNAKLSANCPGGTIRVQAMGQLLYEDEDGCVVSMLAGGHMIYCPSTGEILEDNTYWYWSGTACP